MGAGQRPAIRFLLNHLDHVGDSALVMIAKDVVA